MNKRNIFITEFDLKRLRELIADSMSTEYRNSAYLKQLDEELKRGTVVAPAEVPPDVITMNSRALLLDVETNEEMEYALVFPQDANPAEGKISVLAPIGTAMLGYRENDIFSWQVPDGLRRIKVVKIRFQPEAAGNFDL
ncbi:MAG: nucleoside diphosphate kinase regulator [Chloroflexi bacterium]|nr:nucleoside diphosphate kinase regulator [Chloroflexota bacterium]MDL1942518.1 nucleoside diphosphate kinase regulator [Chloroflexi bacterium CFX2]